jgi:hypothetical protein
MSDMRVHTRAERRLSISSYSFGAKVWPWLVQLGQGRAGWYLNPLAERLRGREAAG